MRAPQDAVGDLPTVAGIYIHFKFNCRHAVIGLHDHAFDPVVDGFAIHDVIAFHFYFFANGEFFFGHFDL